MRRGAAVRQARPRTRALRAPGAALLAALTLAACALQGPLPPQPQGVSGASRPGNTQPPPPAAGQAPAAPAERPAAPPPRQFHLSPATSSLVAQAQRQAAEGNFAQAEATLERALRIEPDNPLVWSELGRVHLAEGDAAQADAMGRKALSLATGDPAAQSAAWRLIADSLRARGRNEEAAEAERRGASLAPR